MKSFLFAFILLVFVGFCHAQTIEIYGTLFDSISNSNLPYGNMILKNNRDSIITGVLSNEKGEFKFKNVSFHKGMYLLTKYMGYNDKRINIEISNKTKVNVGNILLSQNTTQMKEAVVVGNVKYVEQKFDRKVFNINEGKVAAARTIFDLLRTLPGVVVDDEGNVRYKGAEAAIYVDNQPAKFLYPKIEMIPVDKVNKIELIDAAMRSGGNGKGGIINIKLKSINTDGISGIISGKVSSITFKNIDNSNEFLNVNYKMKKILIVNNLGNSNDIGNSKSINEKYNKAFQTPSEQINDKTSEYKSVNYNDFLGMFYNPSEKTEFFLGGGFSSFFNKKFTNELFSSLTSSDKELIDAYNKTNNSKFEQSFKGINLSYKHTFDTLDTYINLVAYYNDYYYNLKSASDYNYTIINTNPIDSLYKNASNSIDDYKDISYSIFYNHPLSAKTRWNLNYNGDFMIKDRSKSDFYIFNQLDVPNSVFKIGNEQTHDLSWRIGSEIKKWKLDAGINVMESYIDGYYKIYNINNTDTNINVIKNYFKILPSITLAYAINDTSEIKLTLSKTSDLPYFYELSDYINKTNIYSWSSGNSKLKPVDFYSVYLGYSYNKETFNASAECFFNYTKNDVAYITIPISSLINLSKPENIAKQSNTGVDVSLWAQVNKNFNFSLSSSIFHTYYNTKSLENTALYYNLPSSSFIKKQFGYNVKYNMEYKIKKFYTMFYINYYAKELTFDGYNKAWINSSFNISRKFYNNKLRISAGVNNILDDLIEHGSYSDNFGIKSDTKTSGSKYRRIYTLSIRYNFKQGDRGTKDLKIGG